MNRVECVLRHFAISSLTENYIIFESMKRGRVAIKKPLLRKGKAEICKITQELKISGNRSHGVVNLNLKSLVQIIINMFRGGRERERGTTVSVCSYLLSAAFQPGVLEVLSELIEIN